MGTLKQYNPKEVTITWRGVPLGEGISDGTFITVGRNERNSALNTGGDGRSTLVINNNHTGVATLSLRAGSAVNDLLTEAQRADEAKPDEKNIGPLEIKDHSGRALHTDSQAFLDGPPDTEFGTDEGDNEWTFQLPNLEMGTRGSGDAGLSSTFGT